MCIAFTTVWEPLHLLNPFMTMHQKISDNRRFTKTSFWVIMRWEQLFTFSDLTPEACYLFIWIVQVANANYTYWLDSLSVHSEWCDQACLRILCALYSDNTFVIKTKLFGISVTILLFKAINKIKLVIPLKSLYKNTVIARNTL